MVTKRRFTKFDVAFCLDCGVKRRVGRHEWQHAARPRCHACGGPIEQSMASAERHKTHEDVAKELGRKDCGGGKIVT